MLEVLKKQRNTNPRHSKKMQEEGCDLFITACVCVCCVYIPVFIHLCLAGYLHNQEQERSL